MSLVAQGRSAGARSGAVAARRAGATPPPAARPTAARPATPEPAPATPAPASPARTDEVTVVVVLHDSAAVLPACLDSLAAGLTGVAAWDLVVVDNASSDGGADLVTRWVPGATVVRLEDNRGYAAGINVALRLVRERETRRDRGAVLILNPDVRLGRGSVRALCAALDEPGIGIAAPRIVRADGSLEPSLRHEPSIVRSLADAVLGGHRAARLGLGETIGSPLAYARAGTADWASGAALAVSDDCIDAVGLWDERFFLYSEETDFARRARGSGHALRYVPTAEVTHLGGDAHHAPALWRLLTVNRVQDYAAHHGSFRTAAFRGVALLNEVLRVATGRATHRAAARALLRPALVSRPGPNPPDRAAGRDTGARAGAATGVEAAAPGWVCFAAQDWWCHNRAHSDFQLMQQVARTRPVLLVNSLGMRMPRPGRTTMPARRIARKVASTARYLRRPVADLEQFHVLSPVLLPFYGSPLARRCNAALVRLQVTAVCRRLGLDRPVVMVTIPTAWPVVRDLPRSALLCNRSDRHSAFAEADGAYIESLEHELLRAADVVVYTSHALMEAERPWSEGRARFLDHGVDLEHFVLGAGPEPADLRDIPRPRIGYFGGLNGYQVDFDLLERLARELPDAHLVLVGRADRPMWRVTRHANVHHLGPKPYEEIPAYGGGFDVAIMPWLDNEWIRCANPIKVKEYLALGLPVVSMDYPDGRRYRPHVVLTDRADEFVKQVARALDERAGADRRDGAGDHRRAASDARRRRVARDAWHERGRQLIGLVEDLPGAPGPASGTRRPTVGEMGT